MLECVGSATTSILVNDSPTDEFSMERGLRQGGPLSSFLFFACCGGYEYINEANGSFKNLYRL